MEDRQHLGGFLLEVLLYGGALPAVGRASAACPITHSTGLTTDTTASGELVTEMHSLVHWPSRVPLLTRLSLHITEAVHSVPQRRQPPRTFPQSLGYRTAASAVSLVTIVGGRQLWLQQEGWPAS